MGKKSRVEHDINSVDKRDEYVIICTNLVTVPSGQGEESEYWLQFPTGGESVRKTYARARDPHSGRSSENLEPTV